MTANEIPALEHTHTGGEATCVSRAICAICGEPYGEYDNSNHVNTEAIPDIAPTCTTDGQTGGVRCADCGAIIEEPTIVPATGHVDADGDGRCDHDGMPVIPEGGYDFDTFRCKMCAKYEANKDIPFVGFIYTIVHFFRSRFFGRVQPVFFWFAVQQDKSINLIDKTYR